MFTVRPTKAALVRPLRSEVLRPGTPPEQLEYEGDDHPLALHIGAFDGDRLVAIATLYPEPPPEELEGEIPEAAFVEDASYRLRGMASLPEVRGQGAGQLTLERALEHARTQRARYVWCNARTGARGFYEKLGFTAYGDEFEVEGIGPHYVMGRQV